MEPRRTFLKKMAGLTAGLIVQPALVSSCAGTPSDAIGQVLPLRRFGRTGKKVTMLGLGGFHLGGMDEKNAEKTIEMAIAGGIRFFDNAESYQNGKSEEWYGKYLVPKYRDHIFLMTKTFTPDADTAREHLEGSLRRLNTDHLDLWQVHSLQSTDDTGERIHNGILDVVLKAKESGKVRHIGFTGHRSFEANKLMLDKTDIFEASQMPINVVDASQQGFISDVLPVLTDRNMGVIAMKTLAAGRFFKRENNTADLDQLIPDRLTLQQALHFVWSLPVSVIVTGVDDPGQLEENIRIARAFSSLDDDQRLALVERVADLAGLDVEYYKR
jgi:predicted aldo/keto reductase-like oxidoreductase